MKNLLFIIVTLLLLQSCKDDVQPEPEKQYSTWKVNGETFTSNDITIGINQVRAGLSSHNSPNRFGIIFWVSYFPVNGEWPLAINRNLQNPDSVSMGIYYNNQPYGISVNDAHPLVASKVNNKASYYLEPTWFVNTGNPNDSVLIEGTFNEP
jgi:hypothetical protein